MSGTYLINLARSTDRKAHMIGQLAKVGRQYEIIEAIDGRELDLSKPEFSSGLLPYEFGCALSHLRAYQKMLDDGVGVALILEDDVLLPADLNELVEAARQHMAGAEAVLLHLQTQACVLTMAGAEQLPAGRKLVQVVDQGSPRSTAAYLITREACERMLKIMGPPVRAVADHWEVFYHEGALDRVRCVVPTPVVASMDFATTRDNLRPGSIAAFLVDTANHLRVPGVYHLLRRRRKGFFAYLYSRMDFASGESAANLPLLTRDSSDEQRLT